MGNRTIFRMAWQAWTRKMYWNNTNGQKGSHISRACLRRPFDCAVSLQRWLSTVNPFDGTFERRVATKLTQNKIKANPHYCDASWNKLIVYNNRTSTMFFLGSVSPLSDNKSRERQKASSKLNQRQTHDRNNDKSPSCQRYSQIGATKDEAYSTVGS